MQEKSKIVEIVRYMGNETMSDKKSAIAKRFENVGNNIDFEAMEQRKKVFENQKITKAFAKKIKKQTDIHSMSKEICNWIKMNNLSFFVSDIDRDLDYRQSVERIQRTSILERMVAIGELAYVGGRRGHYRPVSKVIEKTNFIDADETGVDLWLPFGLHYMHHILPGVIIVAGDPNSGKTTLCIDVAKNNMHKWKSSNYFHSEMRGGELKRCLMKTGVALSEWSKNVNFIRRHRDFAEVIDPNGLNFIDFLKVYKDFYAVGGLIFDIDNMMEDGVCIICIQKNEGEKYALGGQRTEEEARLYLSMSKGTLGITKAKHWKSRDTNDLSINFNITGRGEFETIETWF